MVTKAPATYRVKTGGFLGECETRVLDTSLLPAVQIAITLASSSAVVTDSSGHATDSFVTLRAARGRARRYQLCEKVNCEG